MLAAPIQDGNRIVEPRDDEVYAVNERIRGHSIFEVAPGRDFHGLGGGMKWGHG